MTVDTRIDINSPGELVQSLGLFSSAIIHKGPVEQMIKRGELLRGQRMTTLSEQMNIDGYFLRLLVLSCKRRSGRMRRA